MAPINILIVGGGIAGPVAAFWLAKAGHNVTIIERAPGLLKAGQGIDIEGPARNIVEKMGLLEQMKARATNEGGFAFADDDGKPIAAIAGGLTQEIEIMRGDMCEVLCNAADKFENVSFRYKTKITELQQTENQVEVFFDDGTQGMYDAVIGADGMRSRTRDLAFDEKTKANAFRARDHYCAYFSIPAEENDRPNSRWQHATRGRSILLRPHTDTISSAYLMQMDKSDELAAACRAPKDVQKKAVAKTFEGVGGLAPRLVKGMLESENFYYDSISQIKLDKWSEGRVALVGDAAYAPSAISGQGVILSVLGAYTIAGELSENPQDPVAAFKTYEARLRTHVEKMQYIPLKGKAPRLANPLTSLGIWGARLAFRIIAWTGVWKLFNLKGRKYPLPEYPNMNTVPSQET
ncbi:hypothetical protein CKM354_001075100 [Cercospora kikuchii]|uniref:FAD-binding domain-containing protein n=1 Tax=Cercospora kikuchii TaxID=84275 RepID=A0A9P3CRW9_9PEZI|nr:uncharacterized protein CKM354_001075100 [Cercospora kikuchii]GIZ47666.1 hypothetical protein CKM354_001075100 [Cercospora kikuchii]